LVDIFDIFVEARGYYNRSEAIRDLFQNAVADSELSDPEKPAIGAFGLVFDHSKHLNHKLVHEQHRYLEEIVGTMHVHIDESRCLEVTVLRGTAGKIDRIADKLSRIRGIISGKMIFEAPL